MPREAKIVMPRQTEKEFQAAVLEYAHLRGWRHWHDAATNTPRRCSDCGAIRQTPRNAAGFLDLILIRRPRLVWAELKTETGVVSSDQQSWIDELQACGQAMYIWRPSLWPEIEQVLM